MQYVIYLIKMKILPKATYIFNAIYQNSNDIFMEMEETVLKFVVWDHKRLNIENNLDAK